MTVQKGLQKDIADKIQTFISIDGNIDNLELRLSNANLFGAPTSAIEGMEELKTLAKYCKILGLEDRVVFDMKLARGLDYYTGMIFEAGLKCIFVEILSFAIRRFTLFKIPKNLHVFP